MASVSGSLSVRSTRGATFKLWDGVRTGDVNTVDPYLIWGWPTLDLQDPCVPRNPRGRVLFRLSLSKPCRLPQT